MSKIEDIERQIAALSERELAQFREWFAEFDDRAWDRRLAADASSGKLDGLAEEALQAHETGRTTKL